MKKENCLLGARFRWNPFSIFGEAPASARFDGGGVGDGLETKEQQEALAFAESQEAIGLGQLGLTALESAMTSEKGIAEGVYNWNEGGTRSTSPQKPNEASPDIKTLTPAESRSRDVEPGPEGLTNTPTEETEQEKQKEAAQKRAVRLKKTLLGMDETWMASAPGRKKRLLGG